MRGEGGGRSPAILALEQQLAQRGLLEVLTEKRNEKLVENGKVQQNVDSGQRVEECGVMRAERNAAATIARANLIRRLA